MDKVIETFLLLVSPLKSNIKTIHLFGSRCREDWRPDSDYDVMIVLESRNRDIIDKLYDIVMDILLETGKLISLKIFTVEEYERLSSIPTPFMQNVLKEGIKIG